LRTSKLPSNPTRTRTIENNWLREINRRWAGFSVSVIDQFSAMNDAALITNKKVGMNQTQADAYMAFFNAEIQRLLLETENAPNWQAKYQLESYQRSVERFIRDIRRQGITSVGTTSQIAAGAFTATPSLGVAVAASISQPIHQDALRFLYTRSYESLKGWTDSLSREVRQITFNAVQRGYSVDKTMRLIRDRAGVSRSRARLIAQTETNQAYGTSQINMALDTQELTGEEVRLRWLTKNDLNVRHLHAGWHGTTATPEETAKRKGESPYNCRCGLSPVIGEDTEAKEAKYSTEREAMLRAEAG
jgi:SPP1 gp7 family putative phage head morphogenesis protein